MPQITKLKAGVRRPDRINIYLDERFWCALSLEEVVKQRLKVGLVLSAADCQALYAQGGAEVAYTKILNYLSYRPRSEKEVQDRLRAYKLDEATQESVLTRLARGGYLDDTQFAAWYIRSRVESKPRSRAILLMELRQKGIARDLAEQAVAASSDQAALHAQIKKRTHGVLPTDPNERRKLIQYLLRQGFRYTDIQAALSSMDPEV